MNHDVLIKSDGPTTASIYIDGAPIDGVVAYRIDRSLDPVQRVTFTILAENVTVENLTP